MDPVRHQSLLARREALKQKLRRAGEVAYLHGLPEVLAAAGTPYRLHHREEPGAPDWRRDLVPFGFSHLDWSAVTPSLDVELLVHWYEHAPALVLDAVIDRAAPEDTLLLVGSNGFAPIVELTRRGFEQHLQTLLDLDPFEMWIAGRDKPWLIELRHPCVRAIG